MANPSNVAQEGVVGVDVPPEPSRGREGERAQGKTRGKSKFPSVDTLEPRVTTLEIALSAAQVASRDWRKEWTVSRENTSNSRWQ